MTVKKLMPNRAPDRGLGTLVLGGWQMTVCAIAACTLLGGLGDHDQPSVATAMLDRAPGPVTSSIPLSISPEPQPIPTTNPIPLPTVPAPAAPTTQPTIVAPPVIHEPDIVSTPAAPAMDEWALHERLVATVDEVVPEEWRHGMPYGFGAGGDLPGASPGYFHIPNAIVEAGGDELRVAIAHEWGHVIAFEFGSGAYYGAPPPGFPYDGRLAEEQWADCVAEVLTGLVDPSHGLSPCPASALAFTHDWMAAGPPT